MTDPVMEEPEVEVEVVIQADQMWSAYPENQEEVPVGGNTPGQYVVYTVDPNGHVTGNLGYFEDKDKAFEVANAASDKVRDDTALSEVVPEEPIVEEPEPEPEPKYEEEEPAPEEPV